MNEKEPNRTKGNTMIIPTVAGCVIGGVIGFALYRFVGCSTGACPITSNPWISTIFGVLIGGLMSGGIGK